MGATTSYPFDRTTWALASAVGAAVLASSSIGAGGRSPMDRVYYAAIRGSVGIAPPTWLFGPAWALWMLALSVNIILFANNPVVESGGGAAYSAVFWLFLAWLVTFSAWTPLFFTLRQTMLALFDSIAMLGITVTIICVEISAGETRLGMVYGLLIPIAVWLAYATLLTALVLAKSTEIERTIQNSRPKMQKQ